MRAPSTALSSILSQPRTWTIYFPNIPSMQTNDASRARWMHTVCVYSCRFENRPIMRAERARNRACRCAVRCGGNHAMPRNALSDSLELRCSGLQLSVYAPALNPLLAIRSEIAGAWPSLSTSLNDKQELCAVNGYRDTKNTRRPARQSASLLDQRMIVLNVIRRLGTDLPWCRLNLRTSGIRALIFGSVLSHLARLPG